MKNAFGQEIPELDELFGNQKLYNFIQRTLISVLDGIKPSISSVEHDKLVYNLLAVASYQPRMLEDSVLQKKITEELAHELLEEAGYTPPIIKKALSGRAQTVYSQIAPHVQGTVLDLGCGDGRIGRMLADAGHNVTLADVYKNSNIDSTGLEFTLFGQGESIPTTRQYDTTLLLTVMHHSDDPIATLSDAQRRTKNGGNIVIIESVYGIAPDVTEPSHGIVADQISAQFKSLSSEQQRRANIFFDHFYNRIIHYSKDPAKKVNVPFNFRSPKQWNDIFKSLGLKQTHVEYLGIDQPTVPEYHTLHVLKV